MKKFLSHLAVTVSLLSVTSVAATETIRNFELGHVKIPVYQKGALDFVVFADRGKRNGDVITGKNTLIDRLLKNANVDNIPDGWQVNIYQLNSPLNKVLSFWKKRHNSSEAVLFTEECSFDRKNNVVQGNSEVMMRTPAFDLDGIGFRSDLNKKEIEIRSDVQIVARRDDSDPREILSGKLPLPKQYQTVSASGDSLRLDMLHNEIMLIGNVKVVDGTTVLTCDRLTIFLKSDSNAISPTAKRNAAKDATDSSSMLKGVSRILANGDVHLERRPDSPAEKQVRQYAHCEHLEYEFDSGRIILSGEDELPQLTQENYTITGKTIELLRFSRMAFVKGACRITEFATVNGNQVPARTIDSDRADFDGNANLNTFSGKVTVTDNDAVLKCDRMRVFLKNSTTAKKSSKNKEFSPVSGTQELDRIFCDGQVYIVSKPKKSAAEKPSTLNALRAELDYTANKLVFYDKVKLLHKGDTLECKRLDLFLADSAYAKKSGKTAASGGVALGGRSAGEKTLNKVIASGNVIMKDQQSDLSTDLLTLNFRELPPNTAVTPGMFAANNVQLTSITCDGKVVASSFPGAGKKDKNRKRLLLAEHALSDLLKNRSEFHKNVSIEEENNTLACRDMYVYTGTAPVQAQPAAAAAPVKPEDDPDADPFALEPTENTAPSRIALSDGVDLERIICKNDVLLTNKDKKGMLSCAGGDNAVYTVKTGEITITANAPNRPYLKRDGRIQYSDIIEGNLRTEELSGKGNVQVVTDKTFKKD